jgi:phage shock protein C
MPAKRIYRNQREKVLGGVAAGIADYFDIDVAWVRLAFVVTLFFHGFGFIAYVVAWIVFPKDERPAAELREVQSHKAQAPAAAPVKAERRMSTGSRNAVGIILILLGGLFFLDLNFYWFDFGSYWPLILVGLGLYMIVRSVQSDEEPARASAVTAGGADTTAGTPPEASDHA